VSDRGTAETVSFADGKLTDRTKAYSTLKTALKTEDFIVSWKTEKSTSIIFDLKNLHSVNRVNLWYSGQLPAITVEGSTDGITWSRLARSARKAMMKQNDVLDTTLNLAAGKKVRYLRLALGERESGNPLTLAECEIWGE
jgi:hypothetical protein